MNPTVDLTDTGYSRPRDPVELWLARQWQEVLGFGVGIRENFFGVGGNSLDAARVINAVLEEFGVQLPLNVLTEHPTVAGLAGRLRAQNERLTGPLVPVQRGDGTRPPLFLVHPADGRVGAYCPLAQELGEEHTVYALQAVGLYDEEDPLPALPAMARAYLDAIRAEHPTGPYLLGGCAAGAAIAHEMAARLVEEGAEVPLLAVIDADLVEPVGLWAEEPRELDLPGTLADWKARDLVPEDATPGFVARSLRVWRANRDGVRSWRPRPYPGAVDVFGAVRTEDWPAGERRLHDGDRWVDALRELVR
ncbi:thioesterase domain-containing protein [Saccharothrix syringae]|uniref:Carrier domain-containing protein n=1 Tax=Saccharothrix syringae TaxID=103733 RepID=A0A5Q0H5R7_SACSY|nr:thioesterase domain-containing protein [Saccharothrix syringae]QFZ21245.1 hypothetical protein EKG83_31110 [Saccharothrix syringae]